MKNTFFLTLLFTGIIFLTVQGCSKNKTVEQDIPEVCQTLDITYNDEIKTIINNSCAYGGCHDGSSASIGDFNSYAGMLSRLESGLIRTRAIDSPLDGADHMPPSYAPVGKPEDLTQEESDMLLCWILDNYPEN